MAIIEELREALMGCEDSYREIGRQIEVDHALLTRFAKDEKSLSLETAEKLAEYLGVRMQIIKCYVEVIFPQEMQSRLYTMNKIVCSWHDLPRFAVPQTDTQPHNNNRWEETFGPFKTPEKAVKFVNYTAKHLDGWPDFCVGEKYIINVLKHDMHTKLSEHHGTIGSKKPDCN